MFKQLLKNIKGMKKYEVWCWSYPIMVGSKDITCKNSFRLNTAIRFQAAWDECFFLLYDFFE